MDWNLIPTVGQNRGSAAKLQDTTGTYQSVPGHETAVVARTQLKIKCWRAGAIGDLPRFALFPPKERKKEKVLQRKG